MKRGACTVAVVPLKAATHIAITVVAGRDGVLLKTVSLLCLCLYTGILVLVKISKLLSDDKKRK